MTKEQTLLEIHQILVNLATTTKIFAQVYKDTRFLQLKEALDGDLALMQELIGGTSQRAEKQATPTDQLDKLWKGE